MSIQTNKKLTKEELENFNDMYSYPRIIRLNLKNKCLEIQVLKTWMYDISFERLKGNENWWFRHLSDKVWFDIPLQKDWENVINKLKSTNYGKRKNN